MDYPTLVDRAEDLLLLLSRTDVGLRGGNYGRCDVRRQRFAVIRTNLPDVILCFRNRWNLAELFDQIFTGIIGSERKVQIAVELCEQELHVTDSAFDVLLRIEEVANAKSCTRGRNQLHQAERTFI